MPLWEAPCILQQCLRIYVVGADTGTGCNLQPHSQGPSAFLGLDVLEESQGMVRMKQT